MQWQTVPFWLSYLKTQFLFLFQSALPWLAPTPMWLPTFACSQRSWRGCSPCPWCRTPAPPCSPSRPPGPPSPPCCLPWPSRPPRVSVLAALARVGGRVGDSLKRVVPEHLYIKVKKGFKNKQDQNLTHRCAPWGLRIYNLFNLLSLPMCCSMFCLYGEVVFIHSEEMNKIGSSTLILVVTCG